MDVFNGFSLIQLKKNRLRKEINRLLNKGMSNINLKVTIGKNWLSQNFYCKSLRSSSPGQFLGSSNSRRYSWILKLLLGTEISDVCEQNRQWLFYYFYFERNYGVLKSKSPCFLLNKKIKFNKSEAESKMENSTHRFWEINHVLQLL